MSRKNFRLGRRARYFLEIQPTVVRASQEKFVKLVPMDEEDHKDDSDALGVYRLAGAMRSSR
jgi:hypothetical protein